MAAASARIDDRPRVILGIVDGLHDAGAALVVEGRVVAAANEERFTREKLQGGMPMRSIRAVLEAARTSSRAVEQIAVGGLATPTLATRMFRPLQKVYARSLGICFDRPWHPVDRVGDLVRYRLPITRSRSEGGGRLEAALAKPVLRRALPVGLRDQEITFVDHHLAHAESAWRTAGAGAWLVVTADAHGDGRSFTAWHADPASRALRLLREVDVHASLGAFYSYVTNALGFRPGRHEGKVLGLSARGDASRVEAPFPFQWDRDVLRYDGAWGLAGSRRVRSLLGHAREDLCAWVQAGTEKILLEAVSELLVRSGARQVALAGGVFANVSVNGKIAALPGVDRLHVFPHMGDGGLAAGAALHVANCEPEPLGLATLGPTLDAPSVEEAATRSGFDVARPSDADAVLVTHLVAGRPVVRCVGAMEFGPRALGHRSVLAPAADTAIAAPLGRALERDDFMPFAPVLCAEDAERAFEYVDVVRQAARYMTVALPVRAAFREACPAVVHVDGTARPQFVLHTEAPSLHGLLAAYRDRTDRPALINTSFNMHEEPIVCSAGDAVRAFRRSGLPVMRLGDLVLTNPASAW